jgi:MinD-like ATPase involved in chromosome partitioning or flagellar assembly
MTRIIGVVSGKGGVGKTTVSSNLAVSLVRRGRRVLLIDFNPTTPHLNFHFGIYNYTFTINDNIAGKSSLENSIFRHSSGVDVIPGSLSVVDSDSLSINRLNKLIRKVEGYDYIILDAAPGLGREGSAALNACDEVLIVLTPTHPSIFDVLRIKESLLRSNTRSLGLVLNMVRRQHGLKAGDVNKFTGIPVIISIGYDNNIIKSLSNNLPVTLYKPSGRTAGKFGELAAWLEGEPLRRGLRDRLRSLVGIMLPS